MTADQFRIAVLSALSARKINRRESTLLGILWEHTQGGEAVVCRSHAALADACECSVDTVQRALKRLRALGWVDWTHRYEWGEQISNAYLLNTVEMFSFCQVPQNCPTVPTSRDPLVARSPLTGQKRLCI